MNIATRKQPGEQEAQEGQPMVTITRNQWKSKGGKEEEDEDIGGHRRTTRGARSSVQPHQVQDNTAENCKGESRGNSFPPKCNTPVGEVQLVLRSVALQERVNFSD